MISKKAVLIISALISFPLLLVGVIGNYSLCNNNGICINIANQFFLHFLPFIPVFLISFLTLFLREEIFHTWFKFARIWIPLSMLAILLAPEYSHDWMFPIEKGTVAFTVSLLFIIISLAIIINKQFFTRTKKL